MVVGNTFFVKFVWDDVVSADHKVQGQIMQGQTLKMDL